MFVAVVVIVAVVAAARSTWSPCGWSVLSTMTPLAEKRRGRRYATTALWYVLGAVLGGLTLGGLAAGLAAIVDATGASAGVLAAIGAIALLLVAGSDTTAIRGSLPGHKRQVNEDWLDLYRSWVYGMGYGWQIGAGLVTYIRTTAVYALVVLAALTASPLTALLVCGLFGLVRGLAIYLTARCSTQEQLMRFHRRFAAADASARELTALMCAGAGVALLATVSAWAGIAAGVVIVGVGAIALARRSERVPALQS